MPINPWIAKHSSYWWALYHAATDPELTLEPEIAALGAPYRFQHPLLGCFCDFALPVQKIVVEVDGASHKKKGAPERDAARDAKMAKHGWTVLRLSNETALDDPKGWVRRNLKPLVKPKKVR